MSDYCVIGSGISGATIANLLNKKFQVNLFDKGKSNKKIILKRKNSKKYLIETNKGIID